MNEPHLHSGVTVQLVVQESLRVKGSSRSKQTVRSVLCNATSFHGRGQEWRDDLPVHPSVHLFTLGLESATSPSFLPSAMINALHYFFSHRRRRRRRWINLGRTEEREGKLEAPILRVQIAPSSETATAAVTTKSFDRFRPAKKGASGGRGAVGCRVG